MTASYHSTPPCNPVDTFNHLYTNDTMLNSNAFISILPRHLYTSILYFISGKKCINLALFDRGLFSNEHKSHSL